MAEAPQPVPPAKHALRETMRERLAAMTKTERREASSLACARLINLDEFKHASVVMLYMPLAAEVDTTAIAIRTFQTGKTICVPRVDWERRNMVAVEVSSFDDHYMETDEHGVRTPAGGRQLVPTSIDLIVVPALAFDTHGNRLGRGGGFYDRFLSRLRRTAKTVGLGYDIQIVDQVPADERDVQVGIVVTDRRVSHSRSSRV
ncbi:MAG: 5-formyltetrahydrofolate cyclo-ligase [Planctomycetes bacterium]|nr:5-formyltetrahydrofolate cyclo-ligase [Planctomycetota bacterium]